MRSGLTSACSCRIRAVTPLAKLLFESTHTSPRLAVVLKLGAARVAPARPAGDARDVRPAERFMRNAIVGRHTAGFNTMVGAKALVIGVLCLAIAGCSASELAPLVLEGHQLHNSL